MLEHAYEHTHTLTLRELLGPGSRLLPMSKEESDQISVPAFEAGLKKLVSFWREQAGKKGHPQVLCVLAGTDDPEDRVYPLHIFLFGTQFLGAHHCVCVCVCALLQD